MRVFFGILLSPVLCLAQNAAPAISFSKTHHDFGRVLQGDKVSYRYEVTNQGNAPLQIKEVRPDCGCTYSVVGKLRLEPKESTFINVQFDSAGMMGTVHKSVSIVSDDSLKPITQLTFEVSVAREVMASTSMVIFNEVSRTGSAASSIYLESWNDNPLTVTNIEIPNAPFLSCEAQKKGNDVVLNLNINGTLIPKGINRGMEIMTVNTTSKQVPTLLFQIQWNVPLAITASPNRIVQRGAVGSELRSIVTICHTGYKPFKILSIESTIPEIKVIGVTKECAIEHKFEVILSAEAKAGMYNEKLTIKLDDQDQKELEINIAAILR
jgi:hypothetical protein